MRFIRLASKAALPALVTGLTALMLAQPVLAGPQGKGTTRTNVNKNVNSNQNRNVNVNSNRNVNQNVNVNANRRVDVDVDVDRDNHPIATVAAVATTVAVTSAIVGSMTPTLPPACYPVQIGAVLYQQCGSVWYQPQYYGTSVQYVVINPPR